MPMNFKKARVLEWFDGPLMFELCDIEERKYLCSWCDLVDNQDLWLIFQVDNCALEDYKNGKINLLGLMRMAPKPYYLTQNLSDRQPIDKIPDEYLPNNDSYFSVLDFVKNGNAICEVSFLEKLNGDQNR
jgi:hypothetical protein